MPNPTSTSAGSDHFSLFGLDRRFGLDGEELEREFLRLSRKFHPDRFAAAPAEDRAEIQRSSARVNDAYRTLKDPAARAEYLLELEGVERPEGEAKCPPDLLTEVFELREELAGNPGPEVAGRVRGMAAETEERLRGLFAESDAAADAETRRGIMKKIRETLDRRKFIANLVREVEETLRP